MKLSQKLLSKVGSFALYINDNGGNRPKSGDLTLDSIKLEDLASQLGFNSAEDLFEVVGKDEFSLRNIEIVLRPPEPLPSEDDLVLLKKPR